MNNKQSPLAERLRPKKLADFAGQQHLTGEGKALDLILKSGNIPSIIFWGPPGVGKTTLAMILAKAAGKQFFSLSAVNAGVKDVRAIIETASKLPGALLFIDEIHRFSKSQQDSLLHAVEQGTITLIGATTENPSFEVISPLLSRCQVYVLESLGKEDLEGVMARALEEDEWLKGQNLHIKENIALLRLSGGDARKLLNLLELVAEQSTGKESVVTDELVEQLAQKKFARYDKSGEQHYDIISAFIKSIRGSDPNAALYWMARMVEGGEDPKFIARRLVILASEDIGNANPNALLLANAAFDAVERIGYPECTLNLAQAVTYMASSPKSNASYVAIKKAQSAVRQHGDLPVPLHLRNAPTKLMKQLNYGKEYQYAHDFDKNFVDQEYLPEKLSRTTFYRPSQDTREAELYKFLKARWEGRYDY